MTDHVTTATLKADLATVMRDAEALIKASADQGGEKMSEAPDQDPRVARDREDPAARGRTVREAPRRGRSNRDRGLREAQPVAGGGHRRRRGARARRAPGPPLSRA